MRNKKSICEDLPEICSDCRINEPLQELIYPKKFDLDDWNEIWCESAEGRKAMINECTKKLTIKVSKQNEEYYKDIRSIKALTFYEWLKLM